MSANTPARDYLGHACQLSEVWEIFSDDVKTVRRTYAAADPRALPRQIGIELRQLIDRLETASSALTSIRQALPGDTDETAALLDMACEFSLTTETRSGSLVVLVLLALERGGLVALPGNEGGSP